MIMLFYFVLRDKSSKMTGPQMEWIVRIHLDCSFQNKNCRAECADWMETMFYLFLYMSTIAAVLHQLSHNNNLCSPNVNN